VLPLMLDRGFGVISTSPRHAQEKPAARQFDGRMGTPEQVAATIAFIASPGGRFFNVPPSSSTTA